MQTLAEYVNEMQRIHELFAPHIDNVKKSFETMLREKVGWVWNFLKYLIFYRKNIILS